METQAYISFRSSANLIVLENGAVRSFPLEMLKEWQIGRQTPDTMKDIALESKIVSRTHGKIINIDNEWYYIDLGSKNGTYYNGSKLNMTGRGESDAVKLKNGDILRIDSENLENPEQRGVWMLFSMEGIGNEWKIADLQKEETYFGRDAQSCDVQIPLSYVSARHMVIKKKDGSYYVMDCNSMAGTWVNNTQVHGEVRLKEKDMIAICDCIMIFTDNKIIYNIPSRKSKPKTEVENVPESGDVVETVPEENIPDVALDAEDGENKRIILDANIKSRKVPSNTGHGKKELIRDVHVKVYEGTLVALLGGAGAGKSTVMNCMNGMDTAGAEGDIFYICNGGNKIDLLKHFDKVKSLIGSVPQQETFHEVLTVEQELTHAARLRLPCDMTKAEIKECVDNTLRQLGIEGKRNTKISKCSGGEKRRVNIGIELVADRQLLCLDEPDAGLDPKNKKNLFKLLRSLAHDEGKTILTIIHDVSDIDLFDKIIIMNKVEDVGRLAFDGTPEEARKHFGVEVKDIYEVLEKNPEKYIITEE